MESKRYQGYTEADETLALVNTVISEMNESWKVVNSPLRDNPDEISVLKFAAEGSASLNARKDQYIKKLFEI